MAAVSTHNCSDHDGHDDDVPEWATLPEGESPFPAASEKPEEKANPKPEVSPKAEPKEKSYKDKALSIPEQMEKFRKRCVESGIADDKDLYATLATNYRSTLEVKQIVADFKAIMGTGARGLTPEGENDLIQRISRQAEMALRDSMAKHRVRLSLWSSMAAGAACVLCLTAGGAAGYWMGWTGGQDSIRQVTQDVSAAFAHGPEAAKAATVLLTNNSVDQMLGKCTGDAVFVHNGRKACNGAFWIEPPPAAPVAGR
jgi:hypothetical protein